MQEDTSERRPVVRLSGAAGKWLLLFTLTGLLTWLMQQVRFPASSLLGAMFAAIVTSVWLGGICLPSWLFWVGQGIIGVMVGLRMPTGFMDELGRSWPLFIGGVLWAIVAASVIGLLLTRWKVLPGSTAIWGLSPGAAGAMTVMSEDYGGDIRLVAFMQYLRVLCVVLVTSLVARFWAGVAASPPKRTEWLVVHDWPALGMTLLLVAASLVVARRFRIPSGTMLLPLFAGAVIKFLDVTTLDTPPWLISAGSMLLGWSIGLRFNLDILKQAARSFWRVFFAILAMIFLCGVYAAGMAVFADVEPLTAYLAASPGGLDSIAIIAASANVDISFVMAMQTARFVLVVSTAPFLARFLVRKAGGQPPKRAETHS